MTTRSTNEKLGLPFAKMEKVAICFDVDGTLIDNKENTNYPTAILLGNLLSQGWKNVDFIVWSGRGEMWAREVGSRFGYMGLKYASKHDHERLRNKYAKIIAIDDIQDTALGDVNLIVRNK